jgi:hypothetical protein
MTFIVNRDGVAYEKDLGQETHAAVQALKQFDPDDTWRAVQADSEGQKPDQGLAR